MNRALVGIPLSLALVLSTSLASAAALTVENQSLSVVYDPEQAVFSVMEKASRSVFLHEGKMIGAAAKAAIEPVTDVVFGSGRQIVVTRTDGGVSTLRLYEGLPFVFVGGTLHNGGQQTIDVPKVVPVTFMVDLGKPGQELRTMGTAGLTRPDQNPGSYLFLSLAEPATRRGVVAGWLTNDRGSGTLFSSVRGSGQRSRVEFRAQCDYGHLSLPPGQSAALETLVIGVFADARLGEEQFADAMANQYHIKLRPEIAGYCTWYSDKHGGASDEKGIGELAAYVAKELKPFGFSFLQIDDEWQDGGTYNGPRRGFDRVRPAGPYPHGMQPVAEQLSRLGLTTGLWFMPFARNHQDPEYRDRQHWFARRADGRPYETNWGGTSLDLTQPQVKAHLAALVKRIHSWGINYFKMDGLWTGMAAEQVYVNDGYVDDHFGNNRPLHDPQKTNVEAFRDGLKLAHEAAGPDVFLSGCNVSQNARSLGASIGLVDSMRVGPDNGQKWADFRKEIKTNECGSLISGPIRGSRLYFLNGRVWWNDPDPCYVRKWIPMNQARLLSSWVALSGAFYLNSDWIPDLPSVRLDIIKRSIPAHGATARPIDYFDSILPSMWLVTDKRQAVRRDVLGLFNWENEAKNLACTAAKAGLDPMKTYHAFDFWAKEALPSFHGDFKYEVPGRSCRVIAVRATEDHPVLVSTSRHVTQGIADVSDERWNAATNELSGTSKVIGNDTYELRIAGLNDGGPWKVASIAVSPEDRAAGVICVTIAVLGSFGSDGVPPVNEAGWTRFSVMSKQSRDVRWTVKFKK
jgi:hypothetical protein